MDGDAIIIVAGVLGMIWAVHLLSQLRIREPRFLGEAGTIWGLFFTSSVIGLCGISRATGWFQGGEAGTGVQKLGHSLHDEVFKHDLIRCR